MQDTTTQGLEEPLESYIMVEKDDVLEAIGSFVAAYIAELPQAQNLPPAELQLAIARAFKVLHAPSHHCPDNISERMNESE